MTAPTFARVSTLDLPLLVGLDVEGASHSMTARVYCASHASPSFAVYPLPPAMTPALLSLPSGAGLLFLPDWTDPQAHAYRVPASMLEDVRRALDLRPLLSSRGGQI